MLNADESCINNVNELAINYTDRPGVNNEYDQQQSSMHRQTLDHV